MSGIFARVTVKWSAGSGAFAKTAVGKENQKMEAAVSAGDRIRVKMCTGEGALKHITTGIHVIWTVTDMRTKEVIDKGEFVVP